MKKYFLLSLILTTSLAFAAERQVIQLWPEGVPESNGITENETIKNERISNVTVPSMTVYSPSKEKNTEVAILVCPGGAYIMQAAGHEGAQFGEWLSENGITAFVLKYRLPNKHSFIPHKDASQAIKIIRENASQWGINPAKIGISGFSAGGSCRRTTARLARRRRPANPASSRSLSAATRRSPTISNSSESFT